MALATIKGMVDRPNDRTIQVCEELDPSPPSCYAAAPTSLRRKGPTLCTTLSPSLYACLYHALYHTLYHIPIHNTIHIHNTRHDARLCSALYTYTLHEPRRSRRLHTLQRTLPVNAAIVCSRSVRTLPGGPTDQTRGPHPSVRACQTKSQPQGEPRAGGETRTVLLIRGQRDRPDGPYDL